MRVKVDPAIHVVSCKPGYWYAEVKGDGAPRIEGRGGFESEREARDWAQEVARRVQGNRTPTGSAELV